MNELLIDAHISVVDGPYYPVKLHAIPTVGDLIDLWSFIEQSDGNHPRLSYEVVRVLHSVSDVTDRVPNSKSGKHFVTLFVKESNSDLFEHAPN